MILYSTPCILLHARYKVGLLLEFFPLEKVHSTSTANRTWSPFCHFVAEDLIEISDFFANKILFIFVRLAFRNRENNTLQGYHEAPVDRTHSCFRAYCDKSIGMMKCYTPSVRPSVCLSCPYDLIKIGMPYITLMASSYSLCCFSLFALVSYCISKLLFNYSATHPQVWNKTQFSSVTTYTIHHTFILSLKALTRHKLFPLNDKKAVL